VAESDFLRSQQLDPILVGFENHAGRTWLGSGVQPLARVLKGGGNNGSDSTEGVIYRHTIGTYMHGSFLPKNPAMADWMISTALQRQGHNLQKLPEIDDELAENARKYIQTCK
jgi:CobQ-like glutamine amidotransferase family enzyme